jgi:antitoxin component HigA of HigAB toxin-antitoxin module
VLTVGATADNLCDMEEGSVLTATEMAGIQPTRLAALLADLMRVHGWNQTKLAQKIGWSPAMVSKVLLGERQEVGMELLQRLFTRADVEPTVLFTVSAEDSGQ